MISQVRNLGLALLACGLLAAFAAIPAAAAPPTITNQEVTDVIGTEATLKATIDTHGEKTNWAFEYGLTTGYGSSTSVQTIKAGASKPVSVSARIDGLDAGTLYHFHAGATALEGGGYALGADQSFSTLTGLYVTGEESENPALQPRFAGSSASLPGVITTSGAVTLLSAEGGNFTCQSATEVAFFSMPATTISVPFSEGLAECNFVGSPGSVKMNGCSYVYGIGNEGGPNPPYGGGLSISCPAGKKIELISGLCTMKIGAQSPSSAVLYSNSALEGHSAVKMQIVSATNIGFEKTGFYCPAVSTGSMSGTILAAGY